MICALAQFCEQCPVVFKLCFWRLFYSHSGTRAPCPYIEIPIHPGRLFFLEFSIVLVTKTKHPASPSGLVLFYYLYRGLHPPLYPVGLSGLTLNFLYILIRHLAT